MKRAFISLIVFFVGVCIGYSQEKDVYSDYVGTWKWSEPQTQSELTVVLKRGQADWTRYKKGIKPCIIGAYELKKNGVALVNNLNELSEEKRYSAYPIVLLGNENYMRIYVDDYTIKNGDGSYKSMQGSSHVALIKEGDGFKLKWVIVDDGNEGAHWDENLTYPDGTALPTDIILTKVE